MNIIKTLSIVPLILISLSGYAETKPLKVLSFQGNNGHAHTSMDEAATLLENLAEKNQWELVNSVDEASFGLKELLTFDVVVFNNICGNRGRVLTDKQQNNFVQYIRNGGGFVSIHCSIALWHEGDEFGRWYKNLHGTGLIDHPKVQPGRIIVENTNDISTAHLPAEWHIEEEWYRFTESPRPWVEVLLSLDEDSIDGGDREMGGDHPISWRHHFDGGRSFYTGLGHMEEIYSDENFIKHIEGGIKWAGANSDESIQSVPITEGLLLDLDADYGVELADKDKVTSWSNRVKDTGVDLFVQQDLGREVAGSGRPRLQLNVAELNGHNSVVFHQQELINMNEDAFDHLTQGAGYTWFTVLSVYEQQIQLVDVNSFFGNLRNTNLNRQGHYEGFWGGFTDGNIPWAGARAGRGTGRWNEENRYLADDKPLEEGRYYLLAGRLGEGEKEATIEFFLEDLGEPVAAAQFFPFEGSNPSKMAIGQERDATNHPGKESFDGEIAQMLIYERPLSDEELESVGDYLKTKFGL